MPPCDSASNTQAVDDRDLSADSLQQNGVVKCTKIQSDGGSPFTPPRLLENYKFTWLESLAARILKTGRIPRHLAVIMDGNRRFARQRNEKVLSGHSKGFSKLSEVLYWCRQLNITEVTAYAFSIENFHRPKDEVDGLMTLAEERLRDVLADRERLAEEGVCIRIIGNTSYLPDSLQQVCAELALITAKHHRCFLNIALSYTSRDEMCAAIKDLLVGAKQGIIEGPRDFSESLLSSAMYSRESPDPDLLIRTSGESRLSDFLLWQSSFTVVEFLPALWPELTVWQFFSAIISYQWQVRQIDSVAAATSSEISAAMEDSSKYDIDSRSTDVKISSNATVQLDASADYPLGAENAFGTFIQNQRWQRLRDASLGKTTHERTKPQERR